MKILVALNSKYIKDELEKIYGSDVYEYDIENKEEVIEFLSNTDEEYTVITKDSLCGKINKEMYIKQIRLAKSDVKIIYIVERLENKYKEFLFANEVFNIIEGNVVSINSIQEMIDDNSKVVYKSTIQNKKGYLKEPALNYMYNPKTVPKELIAIYGTSGSGKSFVSSILSKEFARNLNIGVSLLDMDVENPSIDIFNSLDYNINGLDKIVEDVDKNVEIEKFMDKYMIKDSKNKKLWYMTNNVNIFDIKNKLSNKYYEKIYDSIKIKSDYTLIDLPASPFLDVVPYTLLCASKIFFVVNPNYVSIRQAVKYLELLNTVWDIPKERIDIIVNKYQKNSLDRLQIKSLLDGYKLVLNIPYLDKIDSYINGAISSIDVNLNYKEVYKALNIVEYYNDNYTDKIKMGNVIYGMFKKNKLKGNK